MVTSVDKFERFMTEVDWYELNVGEKEALYEATSGIPNSEGMPFRVTVTDDDVYTIEYIPHSTKIEIHKYELKRFRKWLEDKYMYGEDGNSYLSFLNEIDKDALSVPLYTYDKDKLVYRVLKVYFPSFRIEKGAKINSLFGEYWADYVVYNLDGSIKLIVDVKEGIFVSKDSYKLMKMKVQFPTNTIYILTDGHTAVFTDSNRKNQQSSFVGLLKDLSSNITEQKPEVSVVKKCLKEAIDKTYSRVKNNKKYLLLMSFIDTLQDEEILVTKNPQVTISLTDGKEIEFFKILLGEYEEKRIVKFGSSRGVSLMLEKGMISMCSLSCMNDPGETTYVDEQVKVPGTMDNSDDTFIISACAEAKELDLTMWRLYGNDTKGVCVKYEIDKKKLNQNGFYLAPVSYSKRDGKHYELEVIKNIISYTEKLNWQFIFSQWPIWKHFFKKWLYNAEQEIRLIYLPSEDETGEDAERLWFTDDRTSIYSEMVLFKLTEENKFPLRLNKVWLGAKYPSKEENVKQLNRCFKKSSIIISKAPNEEIVSESTIKEYR